MLLDNLCDGLEKFLGFDSASKGYTGQGIVYSDLDRLCDGVMGFLSGVLEDVSEKQPYSVGKETLKTLVSSVINKHLCSGHEGFKKLFRELPASIAAYNSEVRQGNNYVKTPIKTMLDYAKKGGTLLTGINDIHVQDISGDPNAEDAQVTAATKLLNSCVLQAKTFEDGIRPTHDNILDLNHELKIRVMNAQNTVIYERDRLSKLGKKVTNDFKKVEKQINETMHNVKMKINGEIEYRVEDLVKQLKWKVTELVAQLRIFSRSLRDKIQELDAWMIDAEKFIDKVMQEEADKIVNRGVGYVNQEAIKNEAGELKKKGEELYAHLKWTKERVETLVLEAKEKLKQLELSIQDGLGQLKAALLMGIVKYVKGYVSKMQDQIRKITNKTGLEGIIRKLKEYAEAFSNDIRFASIVQGWIVSILHEIPSRGYLETYVSQNKEHGLKKEYHRNDDYSTLYNRIAAIITEKLRDRDNDVINKAVEAAKLANTDDGVVDIEKYVNAVQFGCGEFSQQLGEKIKDRKMTTFASNIVNAIETGSGSILTEKNNTGTQYLLTYVVQCVLNQLVGIARKGGWDFGSLTGDDDVDGSDSDIKKVNDALSVATHHFAHLQMAITEPLQPYKHVSVDNKTTLDQYRVTNDIDEALGKEMRQTKNSEGRVDAKVELNITHFTSYLGSSERAGKKKELDDVIGLINSEITEAFKDNVENRYVISDASTITVNPAGKGELHDAYTQIIKHLTGLMGDICDAGNAVKQTMQLFKSGKINTDLKNLKGRIETLRNTELKQAIDDADNFINREADEERDRTISLLKDYVVSKIDDAQNKLTIQTRTNYVTTIQLILKQFAFKVNTELDALPDAIDRDLTVGFKGFMKDFYGDENGNNINKLQKVKDEKDISVLSFAFNGFFTALEYYLHQEITRRHDAENRKKNPSLPKTPHPYASKLTAVYTALGNVLKHITDRNYYDYKLPGLLDELMDAVNGLTPKDFADPNTAILDGIRVGLAEFVNEMRKVYINMYDGAKAITWDGTFTNKEPQESKHAKKICLTVCYTLFHDLHPLFYKASTDWRTQKIQGGEHDMHLRTFIEDVGYDVANLITRDDIGWNVAVRLGKHFQKHGEFNEDPSKHKSFDKYIGYYEDKGVMSKLFSHLNDYYYVCHLATVKSPKQPCNIYQMLAWLCGLTYNPVYGDLSLNGFGGLFEKSKEDEEDADADGISLKVDDDETLAAYPANITATTLRSNLTAVCHSAYDILTAVLGHGHKDGVYASDYFNNNFNLSYPTSGSACFDMLCDVLSRLYQQLYFVYKQCSNDESCAGWLNCWYGQGVGGSSFNCNTRQCANQICDQKANQMGRQIHEQMGDQHPKCGLKSPLQSFLEDGLPGFLPHQFDKPGCKLTCTYSNHRGLPCKTPMGFADISVMASHTQNGAYLKKVLKDFCGTKDSHLTKLCGSLMCLSQMPPQTLGDIFAFYYAYLGNWQGGFYKRSGPEMRTEQAFREAAKDAYFGQPYGDLDPSILFDTDAHTKDHSKGHLISIADCKSGEEKPCGLYVSSTTMNVIGYYSSEHKANHLSWIVYITETFYDLLKKLYEECCKQCGPAGSKCHAKSCDEKCLVKYSDKEEEKQSLKEKCHKPECKSIITCRNTHPTLYKYGFIFGNPLGLNGSGPNTAFTRTCKDFCEALKKMLDKESVIITLRGQIDNFLWKIREPFSYLVLALWSLSLLYLICVMVGRLDVLHIRSHLRTPSSHKITAQSLLAAAQVGRLAKISYLQP